MTPRAPDPADQGAGSGAGDLESLTDAELADALVAVAAAVSVHEARLARVAAAFDARCAFARDGARTAASWLAARTQVSRPHASAAVHRGRDLRSCPHVGAAWSSGAVSSEVVRLLLRARDVDAEAFSRHEAELVALVRPLTAAHAAVAIARWVALAEAARPDDDSAAEGGAETGDGSDGAPEGDGADGESPEGAPERQPASRCHLSRTLGGRVLGDLDLDAVDGAELLGHIEAWIDRRFQLGTYRADDGLTRSQRQAQALLDLVARGAQPGARHGEPRPSVTVTIDHATLAGLPLGSVDELAWRRCNLDEGPALGRSTVERMLCTARIQVAAIRVLADGTIETVGETDERRHPNRRQRRALDRRDRGCTFPGCDAPPAWCDAHHLIPYEVGGPTLLSNLALLCRYHHHTVHEGGWKLSRGPDGKLRLRTPDGTPVPVPPHGTQLS